MIPVEVVPVGGGGDSHGGRLLGGTYTSVYRAPDGWTYSFIFNSEPNANLSDTNEVYSAAVTGLNAAIRASTFTGSPIDLYPQFPSPELPPYLGQ